MSTNSGPQYFTPQAVPQVKSSAPPPAIAPTKPITPSVAAPATFTTPSGAKVDTQGNLVAPPPGAQGAPGAQNAPAGAPAAPQTPQETPAANAAISAADRAYQESLKISPDELSTQEDLDRLSESAKTAYTNIKGQAIPLEFITGQLKSVEDRALGLAEPLERKLARLQAARLASAESSKFALDRADKRIQAERDAKKPIAGTSFYDPTTGKFVTAPEKEKAPEPFTLSPGELRFDAQGNVIASGGEKPMSAAAETKALEMKDKEEASQRAASASLGIVNNLLTDNNYKAISGAAQSALVPFFGKPEVANQYKQLKSQLALGARSLLKGSGAVSDYEAKVLEQSTSSLGRNLGEREMETALKTVRGVIKTNQGMTTEVRVTSPSGEIIPSTPATGDEIYQLVAEGNSVEYL